MPAHRHGARGRRASACASAGGTARSIATGYAWTRKKRRRTSSKAGDIVEVQDRQDRTPRTAIFDGDLDQTPRIEGAVVAIDNHTGQILAMVGGIELRAQPVQPRDAGASGRSDRSSSRSSTRRRSIAATRPSRCSSTSRSASTSGPDQPLYEPKNYDRKFEGAITLRRALEDSRNVPTIRADGRARPEQVIRVRARAGHHDADSAVSVDRDRCGRRHADRNDVGVFRVPESGRADGAARWSST